MNSNQQRILGPTLLLHPQIPKPLHLVNPRSILGEDWWNRSRKATYAMAGFRCEACGVQKGKALFHHWLEAHEVYEFDYPNGRVKFRYLVALCHACHNYIHQGRMRNLIALGKFDKVKEQVILAHGNRVLMRAGLNPEKKNPRITSNVPWSKWRLVLGDKEYPPKLPDYEAWCRHFGHPLPHGPVEWDDADDEAFGFGELRP